MDVGDLILRQIELISKELELIRNELQGIKQNNVTADMQKAIDENFRTASGLYSFKKKIRVEDD